MKILRLQKFRDVTIPIPNGIAIGIGQYLYLYCYWYWVVLVFVGIGIGIVTSLQNLATLYFLVADSRENCVRSMAEIQA